MRWPYSSKHCHDWNIPDLAKGELATMSQDYITRKLNHALEHISQEVAEHAPVLSPNPSNALYGMMTRSVILSASVPSPEPHTIPTWGLRRCAGRSSASFTIFFAEAAGDMADVESVLIVGLNWLRIYYTVVIGTPTQQA